MPEIKEEVKSFFAIFFMGDCIVKKIVPRVSDRHPRIPDRHLLHPTDRHPCILQIVTPAEAGV